LLCPLPIDLSPFALGKTVRSTVNPAGPETSAVLTRQTGQILRFVGLLTEILCLIGLRSWSTRKDGFWQRLPFDAGQALTAGAIAGAVVWAVGTFAILRARRPGKRSEVGDDGGWL
jgi:hypothetical protein